MKRAAFIGATAAFVTGTATALTRAWGIFSEVNLTNTLIACALVLAGMAAYLAKKRGRGQSHLLALTAGSLLGSIPLFMYPGTITDHIGAVAGAFLCGILIPAPSTLNRAEREWTQRIRRVAEATPGLDRSGQEALAALPFVAEVAYSTRTPVLAALHLNNQFWGRTPPMQEVQTARRCLALPVRDMATPESATEWRDLALIMHGLDETSPMLRDVVEEIRRLDRPFSLSSKVVAHAGYQKGMDALRSAIPDEYLEATII